MAWRAVPGTPTLLPRFEVARLTKKRNPASASFHRSNDGAGETRPLVVMRIVQVPLRGVAAGLQELLSQICTKTSLSPFAGSGAFVASTCTAPSAVQTIPESAPRAAPTAIALGVTICMVTLSAPSY